MKAADITVKQAGAALAVLIAAIGSGGGVVGSAVWDWVASVDETRERLDTMQLHLCKYGHLSTDFCDLFVEGGTSTMPADHVRALATPSHGGG